jgi:predicted ATPase
MSSGATPGPPTGPLTLMFTDIEGSTALPTNLPEPATPYVGRAQELADLKQLLRSGETRLLTLIGFGGIGKTRTALELGADCANEFEHGVWWVDLEEARTGDAFLERIIQQLRVPLAPHPAVLDQLTGHLRERALLLVLDNTEQVPEAGSLVRRLLAAAPRLKCLITTRRPLEIPGERQVEIRPLSAAEAEALFVERARANQAGFAVTPENAADVAELCRRLEGIPLALELAASRVVGMTPRQILERLGERFRLLQTRSTSLPQRQRALRAAIDWSYTLLSEEDRAVFAQLSVFVGGFTLQHAEGVCEAFDVLDSVLELRRHSLFRSETDAAAQETRFLMLEALREYAAEKLAGAPDRGEGAHLRHAGYFLRYAADRIARLRTPDEAAALRQLESQAGNLRAALAWAGADPVRRQHPQLYAELALRFGVFLHRRGFLREAGELLQSGLETIETAPDPPPGLRAHLLLERAGLHLDHDEPDAARTKVDAALDLFRDLEDPHGQAQAENLLGHAALAGRDYARAREHYLRALDHYRQTGDELHAAILHNNLGLLHRRDPSGDKQEAARHLEEALRLRRALQDRRGMAETLNNLGVLAQDATNWDAATRYYAESLRLEQELQHPLGVATALSNLGELFQARGDLNRALRLFAAAERLMQELRSPHAPYVSTLLEAAAAQAATGEAAAAPHLDRLRQSVPATADDAVSWAFGT